MSTARLLHTLAKGLPISIGAVTCTLLTLATLLWLTTPEYSSQVKMLVIQKYTLTDSYTAAKSAEKISSDLAEVVQTSAFFADVVASGTADVSDLLAKDELHKRKEWERKIVTAVSPNTSLLSITAYDQDPQRAEQLAQSVAAVLIDKGSEYHGAPDTIALKVVDSALTSDHPVRPNYLLNGFAALLFGGLLGAVFLFVRSNVSFSTASAGAADRERVEPAVQELPEESARYSVLDILNFADKPFDQLAVGDSEVRTMPESFLLQDQPEQSGGPL